MLYNFIKSIYNIGLIPTLIKSYKVIDNFWLSSSLRFYIFFVLNPFIKTSIKTREYRGIDENEIKKQLIGTGQSIIDYEIDEVDFNSFCTRYQSIFDNPNYQYYSSPSKSKKIIEYYLSIKFSELNNNSIVLDVASHRSVFPEIMKKNKIKTYKQDLYYKTDFDSFIIGGNAINIPMPDLSFTNIFLHDSIQHFEKKDDINFIKEAYRLLKPNGKLFLVPIYFYNKNIIFVDPKFSRKKNHTAYNYEVLFLRNYNNAFGRNFTPNNFFNRFISPFDFFDVKIYHIVNSDKFDKYGLIKYFGVWDKYK